MKLFKYLFVCSLVTLLAVACNKGLDDIIPVGQGDDVDAPTVVINYPVEGKPFVSPEDPGTITFKVLAVDDIELKSVTIRLDGVEIAYYTTFKDYRRLDLNLPYELSAGNHTLTAIVYDKLDQSDEATVNFQKITAPVYTPLEGEVAYFPLDGYYLDLISGSGLTVTGAPSFATGKLLDGYAGAADSYVEFPATGLLGDEFGVAFWYKLTATPQRAGIMAISPEGDSRNYGFRFARENSGNFQNLFVNYGDGATEVWINPFYQATEDGNWMHIAITIDAVGSKYYINGELVLENPHEGKIDWTGCNSLSIASGMPNFVYWEHFSDLSMYDEIHLFNKAISVETIQGLYNVKK